MAIDPVCKMEVEESKAAATSEYKEKKYYFCAVGCKKAASLDEPYLVDPAYGGPEFETAVGLGPNCGVADVYAVTKASERCNALGLDTISVGGTIAFAMECFEEGLLKPEDTGGLSCP